MKSLLRLAVTKIYFKCNGIRFVQSVGLAMGASSAVLLANAQLNSFEASRQKPALSKISWSNQIWNCKDCNWRVNFRGKGVKYESCKIHAKRIKITNEENVFMHHLYVLQQPREKGLFEGIKLFKRYVDDLICTVRDDPENRWRSEHGI